MEVRYFIARAKINWYVVVRTDVIFPDVSDVHNQGHNDFKMTSKTQTITTSTTYIWSNILKVCTRGWRTSQWQYVRGWRTSQWQYVREWRPSQWQYVRDPRHVQSTFLSTLLTFIVNLHVVDVHNQLWDVINVQLIVWNLISSKVIKIILGFKII